jgi:hypothetical protein
MFTFFLQSYKKGLITFCGSPIDNIVFDPDGDEAKYCFRKLENGQYKNGQKIVTRHPNIVKGVISGKKGWGLWRDQWTDGIAEWTFTRDEILNEFFENKIEIPEPLIKEFDDFLKRKIDKRNERELERLGSGGMWK